MAGEGVKRAGRESRNRNKSRKEEESATEPMERAGPIRGFLLGLGGTEGLDGYEENEENKREQEGEAGNRERGVVSGWGDFAARRE